MPTNYPDGLDACTHCQATIGRPCQGPSGPMPQPHPERSPINPGLNYDQWTDLYHAASDRDRRYAELVASRTGAVPYSERWLSTTDAVLRTIRDVRSGGIERLEVDE